MNIMAELKFMIDVDCDSDLLYQQLSTISGLSTWWTRYTSKDNDKANRIHFDFANEARISIEVMETNKSDLVKWKYVGSDPEWKGSVIQFEIMEKEGVCSLRFHHYDLPAYTDFIARCNFSWSNYLRSLKNLCESGTGNPYE
jgi:hypothetical protein